MIYVKPENVKETLEEFLKHNFSINNPNSFDRGKFSITYKDAECTIRECHSARRSFEDLLEISQTYFPETPEAELAKILLVLKTSDFNMRCLYCINIHKWVFVCDSKGEKHISQLYNQPLDDKDEGKYSIQDIYNLAGISINTAKIF